MTDSEELPPEEVRRRAAATANRHAGAEWAQAEIGGLSDWELIGSLRATHGISYPMEMDRRLKDAIEELTAETVSSRRSSEKIGTKLADSIAHLTVEIVTFRESSDAAAQKLTTLTNWLIGFTAALVLLTVGVLILTAVLAPNA